MPNAQHVQQRDRVLRRLVGDAGQPQACSMQLFHAFLHTRIQMTGASVDAVVVLLVAGVRAFIQGAIDGTIAAQSQMQQSLANQMGRTLANHALNEGTFHARPLLLGQHAIERKVKISQCIDHRAIQIDHDGPHINGPGAPREKQAKVFFGSTHSDFSLRE